MIKWGYTKSGASIFKPLGSTKYASGKTKKMCGAGFGKFKTGLPSDPYPKLNIEPGSNSINQAIKGKKVVRMMGQ